MPDEGGIENAQRKLIKLNGQLTEKQRQAVANVAVFSHLPTWFYMGKFKRMSWRTFPEDEIERGDLLAGLDRIADALGMSKDKDMTLTPSEVAAARNIAALLLCNSLDVEVRSAGFEQTLHPMIAKLLLAGWPLNDAVRP